MHCFSSTPEFCLKLVQKGFYISFAGNLTFKHSENLQEAIKVVPSEKLLLETDSPYLSPIPLRGRINTPLNIIYTYKKAAELRHISVEILIDQIINNFENFSKLLTQN